MITLVLGGARSGKSAVAEVLARASGSVVTYIATGDAGNDEDFRTRIAEHQRRRPAEWATIECGQDLVGALAGLDGTVLVDSLGTWIAKWPDFAIDTTALLDGVCHVSGHVVIVSDEVGMGVHPSSDVGRAFRDAVGSLNQAVANVADSVLLVVAGQVVTLKSGPST